MEDNNNEIIEEEISDILNSSTAEVENKNKRTPIANGIIVGGIATFIIMCILGERDLIERDSFNILTWILIITGVLTGFYIYYTKANANEKYKENVMPDIIEKVFENSFYNAEKFIDKELYYESGLFEVKDRTNYSGSDYIEYERDEIKTVASKLKVTYTTGSGKSTSHHTQFLGEYFINIFEKEFEDDKLIIEYKERLSSLGKITDFLFYNIFLVFISAVLYIITAIYKLGAIALVGIVIFIVFVNIKKYMDLSNLDELRKFGEKYGKEFSNMFLMIGSYVIADKILTEDLTKALIEAKKYKGVKTNISIRNNIVYIAFETGRELFASGLFDDNKEKYEKDYYLIKEIRKVNDIIADKVLKALK